MSSMFFQPRRARAVPATQLAAALYALVVCIAAPACMRGQAKTMPEVPLTMPAPPPREVEVRDLSAPPIVTLPEEPVHTAPPRPAPSPPQRTEARPPDTRPEPAADVPRPIDEATRTPLPPTLQTTPAQQEGEVERRIRALLAQATGDLNRINVQSLNADARQQFDTARRFVSQAHDAIRTRNLMFASNLADKAAALAAQLAGR